jgi:ribosomal protein S18 acetylase RimI-like enzyme
MTIELIKGDYSFFNECNESLHNSDLGKYYFPSIQKAEEAINAFIDTDYFLVAIDEDKKFVGFICYLPTGAFHAFPYLHLLVTSSKLRGKGIGTLIMDQFEKLIFEQKDKLFLVVASFNPKGKEFYLRRNYAEVGMIPSLYRNGIDEYLMMKRKDK